MSPAAVVLTRCVFGGRCSAYDLVAFSEGLALLCPELFSSPIGGRPISNPTTTRRNTDNSYNADTGYGFVNCYCLIWRVFVLFRYRC
ncbi:hypothetical protein B0O99DRAFT_636881 [Bisporella sp. PMI_857]|nr:hypothetical protein B0O99DRAFT_636881 [Bisporella sp. PMI_857]